MLVFDLEAASGIFGAMSIACWIVVLAPQIVQNFQRKNADALSFYFIFIWLVGDIFNIIGSVLQGVLTSMIILAVYYTAADLVLLSQMLFYRRSIFYKPANTSLSNPGSPSIKPYILNPLSILSLHKPKSPNDSLLNTSVLKKETLRNQSDLNTYDSSTPSQATNSILKAPHSLLLRILWNTLLIIIVLAIGFLGWFISIKISNQRQSREGGDKGSLEFSTTGQVFGYLGAITYTASRIPQLYLNWKRKTTDGLSMLFFTFACFGNITFVLSILVYEPSCAEGTCEPEEANSIYIRYIIINLSWLSGATINFLQDCGIFIQHFLYSRTKKNNIEEGCIVENTLERQ